MKHLLLYISVFLYNIPNLLAHKTGFSHTHGGGGGNGNNGNGNGMGNGNGNGNGNGSVPEIDGEPLLLLASIIGMLYILYIYSDKKTKRIK